MTYPPLSPDLPDDIRKIILDGRKQRAAMLAEYAAKVAEAEAAKTLEAALAVGPEPVKEAETPAPEPVQEAETPAPEPVQEGEPPAFEPITEWWAWRIALLALATLLLGLTCVYAAPHVGAAYGFVAEAVAGQWTRVSNVMRSSTSVNCSVQVKTTAEILGNTHEIAIAKLKAEHDRVIEDLEKKLKTSKFSHSKTTSELQAAMQAKAQAIREKDSALAEAAASLKRAAEAEADAKDAKVAKDHCIAKFYEADTKGMQLQELTSELWAMRNESSQKLLQAESYVREYEARLGQHAWVNRSMPMGENFTMVHGHPTGYKTLIRYVNGSLVETVFMGDDFAVEHRDPSQDDASVAKFVGGLVVETVLLGFFVWLSD